MNLELMYQVSLYEELKTIHESRKTKVILANHTLTDKIYIKKVLTEYNKEVYEQLKSIKSKNICKIHEIFEIDDELIIIEEFINGKTLQDVLKEKTFIEEKQVVKYIVELCNILDKLHNLNPPVIHRDIKPSNIMISNDNILKLIDFDISRTYKDGENMDTTLLGSKGYASPEQFGFEQTDCRSDIYAIGIMMNVLITGKHIKEERYIGTFGKIINKCTKMSPDERYQSIKDLRNDLIKSYNEKFIKKETINNKKETKNIKPELNLNKSGNEYNKNSTYKKYITTFLKGFLYVFLLSGPFLGETLLESYENTICAVGIYLMYLFCINFKGIKNKLPLTKEYSMFAKMLGHILYITIIILMIGMFLP